MTNFHVFKKTDEYVKSAVEAIESFVLEKLEDQKVVRIALSGGSSPVLVYEALTKSRIPWSRVCLFLVDERYVPPNSNDSNAKMIQEVIVNKVSNLRKFYQYNTRKPIATIVDQYQKTLEDQKGSPLFDLVILGLGSDGHTASLFPNIDELHEDRRLVVHTQSPDVNTQDRLSLAFPAVLGSSKIIFLIRGADKKKMVDRWLSGKESIDEIPATKILEHENVEGFYDQS